MGTFANIVLVRGTEAMLDELVAMAQQLERLWSRFLGDSDISRLNNAEGAPTQVNPLTVSIVREMIEAYKATDGEYDPTILPKLIDEGYATSLIDPSRVTRLPASARWPIDPTGTVIDGNTVTLPVGVTLDSGGIGKGFAADILTYLALELGAQGALAEFGGDVSVKGLPPQEQHWYIGISDPFVEGSRMTRVQIKEGGVATSSTLKRNWDKDGRKANHLIDPHTGISQESSRVAVTVIAPTARIAEALTKPGFTKIDFLQWVVQFGAAALVVNADGTTRQSTNWKDYSMV